MLGNSECTLAHPVEKRNADSATWPLGSRLYLTKKWAGVEREYGDLHEREQYAEIREKTVISDEVEHQPKYVIGASWFEDAFNGGRAYMCDRGC